MCFTSVVLTLLSVFTLNGDIVTVTTPSDCRWLQVECQPHGGAEREKREERRKVKVPATGNMVSNFCAAVFLLCLVVPSSSLSFLSITLLFIKKKYKNPLFMFNVPLLQFLCEVKQRAIEELQLQERPPGKLLGVKHAWC